MSFSDFQIFQELIKGKEEDTFYKNCISQMLRQVAEDGCITQKQVLNFLGQRFRVKLNVPEWYMGEQVAEFLLEYVLRFAILTSIVNLEQPCVQETDPNSEYRSCFVFHGSSVQNTEWILKIIGYQIGKKNKDSIVGFLLFCYCPRMHWCRYTLYYI